MIIHTLQEYINTIEMLRSAYAYEIPSSNPLFRDRVVFPQFIFRGHSNHGGFKLIPGIFRWKDNQSGSAQSEFSQLEHNILNDFTTEACRFITNVPVGDIPAWLEIAQHFGVPTRLLDFTQNPLVALYFACIGSSEDDGSVWIINELSYNQIFFNQIGPFLPIQIDTIVSDIVNKEILLQDYSLHNDPSQYYQYPLIYKPCYREDRMNSQSSVFMLWGALRMELPFFMKPEHYMSFETTVANPTTGIIGSIIIPADMKPQIIAQLDTCGINEKFIYPGIDGIGRYIRKKYSSTIII